MGQQSTFFRFTLKKQIASFIVACKINMDIVTENPEDWKDNSLLKEGLMKITNSLAITDVTQGRV